MAQTADEAGAPATNKQKAAEKTASPTSSKPAVLDAGDTTMRIDVFKLIDDTALTISFDSGSTAIDAKEKKKLEAYLERMRRQAAIDKVIVGVWADQDYPPSGETLPEAAKSLAKARGDRLAESLDRLGDEDVDIYSMTERPNWFQKAFSTEGAEVRGAARTDWLADEVVEKIGAKLRSKGGPSKAVIVTRFENQVVAH